MRKIPVAVLSVAFLCALAQTAMVQEQKEERPKQEAVSKGEEAVKERVVLEKTPPFVYCAVEMKGSYDQHMAAFGTLYGEVMKQAVAYDDIPFGIYWNSPDSVQEKDLRWEIGFKMLEEREVKEPLVVKKWEFTQHAVMDYEGSFSEDAMGKVYGEMFGWIAGNGYEPAGPCMERYLRAPTPNEEGELAGSVRILVPILEAKK